MYVDSSFHISRLPMNLHIYANWYDMCNKLNISVCILDGPSDETVQKQYTLN